MSQTAALPIDTAKVGEVNERYWARLIAGFNWPLKRNADSIAYMSKVNAAAPSRRHRLCEGFTKDGRGQFWRWSGTPSFYVNVVTGEKKNERDIPTPHLSSKFPEEAFGWELCPSDGEVSEVEENERQAAQIELSNCAIHDFITNMKERMCRMMVAHAQETFSRRVAFAAIRAGGRWPAESEWTNRSDTPAIVKALHLSKPLTNEFESSGAIIGVMLNWLEALSGLTPASYCY